MEQFTKGEWKITEISEDKIKFYGYEDGFLVIQPVDKAKRLVATIPLHHHQLSEIKANAYLIAASPDLYEALKYAGAFCEAVGQGLVPVATRDMVRDIIDQAIAKAEGKDAT